MKAHCRSKPRKSPAARRSKSPAARRSKSPAARRSKSPSPAPATAMVDLTYLADDSDDDDDDTEAGADKYFFSDAAIHTIPWRKLLNIQNSSPRKMLAAYRAIKAGRNNFLKTYKH